MKHIVLSLLVLFLGASLGFSQDILSVAAAANLSSVEIPLAEAFAKAHPGMALRFTFGASGALVTQISNGAPFQAFLSADLGFAQKLVDNGSAVGPVRTYAVGKLIFLALKPVDLSQGLSVLLDPKVAQFANCNPEIAPYGRAAVEALTATGLYEKVRAKQVTAQSVTQALQFTLTATDFGFVNKSALFTKEVLPFAQEGKYWFEVDQKLYSPVRQGFVILKSAGTLPVAQAFSDFLLSSEAQKIFGDYGYGKP